MNEFKRCMRVFSHSPFKVRLMLLSMLCDMVNNKPQQDKPSGSIAASRYAASLLLLCRRQNAFWSEKPHFLSDLQSPSQKICTSVVDLNGGSLYLLAALRILRLADATPFHSSRTLAGIDP